ncbi:MAG: UDP-N-acetylglucosamine1-carboxyvinyltransferase [Acidimicrobiales bacterium]|nr:UDP-N-acetylglucosamine1-carboxyvinyltransferase [Acidimicrobiales bacterium]HZB72826.1 UDP-N-acetylglucosamine 1-carboxyvinyltransferase [Acidimicrobiales bacterium]
MPPTAPSWRIDPGGPLRGDVVVKGSKNAVTKHMVAAMLGRTPSTILNCPAIGDVDITAGMLRDLGATVEVDGDGSVVVHAPSLETGRVPVTFGGLNRIPILLVGPLLHRMGEAFVPLVGGDRIGARPVNYHVRCLEAMGAEVQTTPAGLEAKATKLHGARIRLPFPSVGATETVLLTAALAEGRTVLENSAIEPEVIELALFLQRMGARIELRPDRRFVIEGVERLDGARHSLSGDRIEAYSYLVAGLVTGGRVRVHGCAQDRLVTGISTLHRMGARFEITDEWVAAEASDLRPAVVQTDTHPGFMTDWQSPLVVLFTQCHGLSVLHETLFEGRFPYVAALQEMGAEVELYDSCLGGRDCRFHEGTAVHSAVVRGPTPLHGTEITVPDIRGGFAYVLAAAAAEGPSLLHDVHHLERGYHRPLEAFEALGLPITRC